MAVTLAEVRVSGHYSVVSTTVCASVSASAGKGGFINALFAAQGRVHQ